MTSLQGAQPFNREPPSDATPIASDETTRQAISDYQNSMRLTRNQ